MSTAEAQARLDYYQRVRALQGPELAIEIVALVEENLRRWDQDSWRRNGQPEEKYEEFREDPLNPMCRTSFCVAGWVVAIDGTRWGLGSQDMVADPSKCNCTSKSCLNPAHQMYVSDYARQRLQLTGPQADRLFRGENTLDDLQLMADTLVRGGDILDVELDSDPDDDDEDDEDDEGSDD